MELQSGTLLREQFLIEKAFGTPGGMGRVYKARCQKFRMDVVLKQNLAGDDPALRRSFESEARLLRQLNHPNLPRVTDFFDTDDGQFLVMDYISGKDFYTLLWEQKLKGEPFPVRDVLKWAQTLLGVLKYLHSRNPPVIHRDIKPANIKLDENGHLFLLDFGIAKGVQTQATTNQKSILGYTVNYSPLEQLSNRGTDHQSDLYALAATLHHLLAGFDHMPPSALDRSTAISDEEPDPLPKLEELNPDVPPSLAEVIRKAMAIRKPKRTETAGEFALQIEHQLLLLRKSGLSQSSGSSEVIGPIPDFHSQETKQDPPNRESLPTPSLTVEELFNRGNYYRNKGDYDRAIAAYTEAIRLKPDYAFAFNNRGVSHNKKGEYDLAIADYTEAIRLKPDASFSFINRGNSHNKKGEYDLAIADYNEAIRLNPDDALPFNKRGNAHKNKGDHDRAIADYAEATRLNPNFAEDLSFKADFADAFNNRGLAYFNEGDYDRAIADFSEAIRLTPDDAVAFHKRGNSYNNKGEYDLAIDDLDKAIFLKPDFWVAFNDRGIAYFNKGAYYRAIADLNEALRHKPDYAIAFNNRGTSYNEIKSYDDAIADFNEAIRLKPDFAVAYNNRGFAFNNKGDFDRAITDYNESIRHEPNDANTFLNRGITYRNKSEYDRAIADYNLAIQLKPNFAEAFTNRGIAYEKKGDKNRAIADYRKAIELEPKNEKARENLRRLTHSMLIPEF